MAPRVLVEIDTSATLDQRDLQTIFSLGGALITATRSRIEAVKTFLLAHAASAVLCVDAVDLAADDVVALLNTGASKVFVAPTLFNQIVQSNVLENVDRLVLSLDKPDESNGASEAAADSIQNALTEAQKSAPVSGIHLRDTKGLDDLDQLRRSQDAPLAIYTTFEEPSLVAATKAIQKGFVPVIPTALIARDSRGSGELLHPIERLITCGLQSDRPDGLFSTAVVDPRGTFLGLVYSNEESIRASLQHGRGVYWSRKRGLWFKGDSSGDIQLLQRVDVDCDGDTLQFVVRQQGDGFCHLKTATCFGDYSGLARLEQTLQSRKKSAPPGSYTARLFRDPKLVAAKIMEEASELCEAQSREEIAAEAADLFYFALTKCIAAEVNLQDIEDDLNLKNLKVSRRKGDAKPQWAAKMGLDASSNGVTASQANMTNGVSQTTVKEAMSIPKAKEDPAGLRDGRIQMARLDVARLSQSDVEAALQRPSQRSTDEIMGIVKPIIDKVRTGGDTAVLEYTHKFEKATSLTSPVLHAPFPDHLMQLDPETRKAIDLTFANIRTFHTAQETQPMQVETMPGVVCSRFSRPIERVGLYVPGGTAVLPSTALMLGVPAMVAGCKTIVLASPPRKDGTLTPEVVYVAHKVGASSIVLAGGAQAIAALAYGTNSIPKVDKILGPGNQFVTAAKMLVSQDTVARVAIDMPAGPSEVLVIADSSAEPAFVAADLLSQAEHGVDSQVVLLAVNLDAAQLAAIEDALNTQANALPRVDIVRGAIAHSVTLVVPTIEEAIRWSNYYAPEHLILQVRDADRLVPRVENAGSVFIGPWAPESVGDYSAGVNHSLPTYGYAKQYSGVNLGSFTKHITSSQLTPDGLRNVGGAVMELARVEQLEAHRRAVGIRLEHLKGRPA